MVRVLSVDKLKIHWIGIDVMFPILVASGEVNSLGWTKPNLSEHFYTKPPKDGILDFEFEAQPPSLNVGAMLTPILAYCPLAMSFADFWGPGKPLLGVRVHAATNKEELLFDDETMSKLGATAMGDEDPYPLAKILAALGDDIPFPVAGRKPGPDIAILEKQLVGKKIRVYHSGDMLTTDFVEDRINIELHPATHRVVAVWRG